MIGQTQLPGSKNTSQLILKSLRRTCLMSCLTLIPVLTFAQEMNITRYTHMRSVYSPAISTTHRTLPFPDSPVIIFTPALIPADGTQDIVLINGFPALSDENEIGQTPSFADTNVDNPKPSSSTEPIEVYIQAVSHYEVDDDAYNVDLIDALDSLAFAYRQQGQFDLAIETYYRAIHLVRNNQGLSGSAQNILLESLSETLVEAEEIEEASAQQRYLLQLKLEQNSDDLDAILQANIDYADWNYALATNAYHFKLTDNSNFVSGLILEANMYYSQAVQYSPIVLNTINNINTPINRKLIETNFLLAYFQAMGKKSNIQPPGAFIRVNFDHSQILKEFMPYVNPSEETTPFRTMTGYQAGEEVLATELLSFYSQETIATEQFIRAILNLADWNAIFGKDDRAMSFYQEAYTLLQEGNSDSYAELSTEVFRPSLPQEIPVFIPSDHSRQAYHIEEILPENILGYIDVSFRVDRHGQTNRIKILDASPDMDKKFKKALKYDISKNLYRPRFEDGNPVSEVYTLRYYVSSVE